MIPTPFLPNYMLVCTFFVWYWRLICQLLHLLLNCLRTFLYVPHSLLFLFSYFNGQRDARKGRNPVSSNDSYDMESVVMPLHEYINDPIAKDIIHNGATFQVF